MRMTTIYRFSLYDIRSDEMVVSRRWGTREAITKIGGQVLEDSAAETDERSVESDVAGFTEVGFTPPTGIIHPVVAETIVAESIVS